MNDLKQVNPQKFWSQFRQLKTDSNNRLFTINNKQDKDAITTEFANHFDTLLNTPRVTNNSNILPRCLPSLDNTTSVNVVCYDDVKLAISNLKSNKCPDPFNILAEHLKCSNCNELLNWITDFSNHLLKDGITPASLSTSKIVPLVKSYKKSLNDPNNYRGISIIPVFTKLLEYLILILAPELSSSHPSQYGFKRNSSTLHAEFLISETIKLYNNNSSPVSICSLDAEKAFDSCNWDILFEKLYFEKNIPLNIVQVILSLYNLGTASISYKHHSSRTFKLKQGVRQGSILSPHLYNIYNENLLHQISSESSIGTSIYGNFTGIVAYADDIILLSTTLSGLCTLVDKCESYGRSNLIKLNAVKTEFMVSGKSPLKNTFISIGNTIVTPQNKLKHLGFTWDNVNDRKGKATLNNININERISQAQVVGKTLIKNGIRFCHPSTIVQLYNSLIVPTLTYGFDICEFTKDSFKRLDIVGRSILKSLFDISKHGRNYLHTMFNIDHISFTVNRNKLNLFTRLINNENTRSIILSQLVNTIERNSFVYEILSLCDSLKINFYDLLVCRNKIVLSFTHDELPIDVHNTLALAIDFWHIKEQRQNFKALFEENIHVI